MELNLSEINKILKDLDKLRNGKAIQTDVVKEVNGEYSNQGEEGLSYEVYRTSIDGIFVRLKITTDSYGDNESISGVEFVKPEQKMVTVYEKI